MLFNLPLNCLLISIELGFRRRRSTDADDMNMVSILESLDSVEQMMNQLMQEIRSNSSIDRADLCQMKWKICQISQGNRTLHRFENNASYRKNLKTFESSFMRIRYFDYLVYLFVSNRLNYKLIAFLS